ncbi:unnamed protein product [Paramecium sonneborni]|uniref:Uncharacterized protein n=1 Tax=Paramecium sonneborni TaxID=65129 RepID=A0A8S1RNA3_9CILI|nr:unnamed protein product [Paramecium sonneborni]
MNCQWRFNQNIYFIFIQTLIIIFLTISSLASALLDNSNTVWALSIFCFIDLPKIIKYFT